MSRGTFTLFTLAAAAAATPALAQVSNIDEFNKNAWCENIGFTNWRDADATAAGVHVYPTHLRGAIWAENVGWIRLGSGPADGFAYANIDNTDYGVNVAPGGALSGLGWGENIGWVNFAGGAAATPSQPARIDTTTPPYRMLGYAWCENVGWINLDNPDVFIGVLCFADFDGNGFVNADDFDYFMEAFYFGTPAADIDGNGFANADDFDAFLAAFYVGC